MEEDRTASKISRRRMIQRLGVGTAVAWLTPVVSTFGARAEAGCVACEDPNCGWTCGGTLIQCGSCGPFGAAYCSHDVDGKCFCWEDGFCADFTDCAVNSDCPAGYACIPDTCCGVPKCIAACGMAPRTHRRRGRRASGKVVR
jgi:hypothetical protein